MLCGKFRPVKRSLGIKGKIFFQTQCFPFCLATVLCNFSAVLWEAKPSINVSYELALMKELHKWVCIYANLKKNNITKIIARVFNNELRENPVVSP